MHQQLLFVSAFSPGDEGAIHSYLLDLDSGQLAPTHRTTDIEQPFYMVLSPCQRFLFVNHSPGTFGGSDHEQMAAYQRDGQRGELELINRQSTQGTATCYCDIDATGRTLVIANYTSGSVAAFPISVSGQIDAISSLIEHHGSSVDSGRQTGPHAHCTLISPDNRFVLSADLGLDQILVYRLQAASSQLAPASPAFVNAAPGAGPRHLVFHPSLPQLYCINELDNTITMYDYHDQSGKLTRRQTISTLPESFSGRSHCADVKISPDGRWLYGTNRGHDSIVTYRVGDGGRLTLQRIESSHGKGPQNLAITADGNWLLCANMPGQNLAVFRIDRQTGGLALAGDPVSLPNPSCIVMV